MRRFMIWGLALYLALTGAAVLSACAQSSAKKIASPAPTATARPADRLPTFSDWRAAYLGGDGRVHAVTLDGKTDVMGPILPNLTVPSLNFASSGISPDGHLIAYAPPSLNIVDLAGQHADILQERTLAYTISWSSDGNRLALDQGDGTITIASTADGSSQVIHGSPAKTVGNLLGWIDSTHLAITDIANQTLVTAPNGDQYATSVSVAALDIATGQVRLIAHISNPGLGSARFTLSPDGTRVLFSNARFRDYPYSPLVEEINTATGAVTPLPAIDQATGSGFTSVAWQRGTNKVAVSTGFIVNGDLKDWLLDMGQDTAQPLPNAGYVAGWVPDSSTVLLTTGQNIGIGDGPFTLTALVIGTNGQVVSNTVLTQSAMTFPFLGFVRTA